MKPIRRKVYSLRLRVLSGDRPLFQLPFEVPTIEHIHLQVAKSGQQPGQERGVDVPGLAGTVDHHSSVQREAQSAEQLSIHAGGQELGWHPGLTGTETLRVEISGIRQVALEIREDVGPNVYHRHLTLLLPVCQLIS